MSSLESYLHDSLVWEIKKALRIRSMPQVELASRVGFTWEYVSRLLCGHTPGTLETWDKLAKALDLEWCVALHPETQSTQSSNGQTRASLAGRTSRKSV